MTDQEFEEKLARIDQALLKRQKLRPWIPTLIGALVGAALFATGMYLGTLI